MNSIRYPFGITPILVLVPCEAKDRDGWASFHQVWETSPVKILGGTELRKTFVTLAPEDRESVKNQIQFYRAARKGRLSLKERAPFYQAFAQQLVGHLPGERLERAQAEAIKYAQFLKKHDSGGSADQYPISRLFTEGVEDAKFVLWIWEKEKRLVPALWCRNVRTAVLLQVLISLESKSRTIVVCPRCNEMFMQGRPDQDYCSASCREAHRVARFRAKNRKPPRK
jgi:hypothetical protein